MIVLSWLDLKKGFSHILGVVICISILHQGPWVPQLALEHTMHLIVERV